MRLTEEQKTILAKIKAPYLDNDKLSEEQIELLCDYITDYVLEKELLNGDITLFGEQLLSIHDDIV